MNTHSMQPRLRVTNGRKNVVTVNPKPELADIATGLATGIYDTTYGTQANVVSPYIVWDITYRQPVDAKYLIPFRLRRASRNEFPSYYGDSGRDETVVRGVWFDRTGKRKPRKW